MTERGFAYVDAAGNIHVDTVAETEFGAMKNALRFNLDVFSFRSDTIAKVWEKFHRHAPKGSKIVPVTITIGEE